MKVLPIGRTFPASSHVDLLDLCHQRGERFKDDVRGREFDDIATRAIESGEAGRSRPEILVRFDAYDAALGAHVQRDKNKGIPALAEI